jgi:hypothetical protein
MKKRFIACNGEREMTVREVNRRHKQQGRPARQRNVQQVFPRYLADLRTFGTATWMWNGNCQANQYEDHVHE